MFCIVGNGRRSERRKVTCQSEKLSRSLKFIKTSPFRRIFGNDMMDDVYVFQLPKIPIRSDRWKISTFEVLLEMVNLGLLQGKSRHCSIVAHFPVRGERKNYFHKLLRTMHFDRIDKKYIPFNRFRPIVGNSKTVRLVWTSRYSEIVVKNLIRSDWWKKSLLSNFSKLFISERLMKNHSICSNR